MMKKLGKWITLGLALLVLTACKPSEVVIYVVPSEEEPSVPAQTFPSGHPSVESIRQSRSADVYPASSVSLPLIWDVPEGWVIGSEATMRIQTLLMSGVSREAMDISVTRFPGDVGGLFSNVNRWRMQIGMQPLLHPDQLESLVSTMENDAFEFVRVQLESDTRPSMKTVVAILELDGYSWFFKMTGTMELAETAMDSFDKWVASIRKREAY